jgi:hypothetical protein
VKTPPAIVGTLRDLENPERAPEVVVLPFRTREEGGSWQRQEAEWVGMLLHMAQTALTWRSDDMGDEVTRLARDIARCAADPSGGMPSLYGAGITLVVTRERMPRAEVAA